MSTNNLDVPRITIVTVSYNVAESIAKTVDSVLAQTYQHIEYIVIDGDSTDETQKIIKSYGEHIAHFVSEPDEGPYDAMNKGIDLANGEWILFMNSGDYFFDNTTVSEVFDRTIDDQVDFIYGDYIWKGVKHEKRIACRPLDTMWQRISFSHQSLFARTRLMRDIKFSLSYKIVSDYNFYYTCYNEGCKFLKVDMPISVFRAGGLSDVNFFQRTYERWKVARKYKKGLKIHIYYLWFLLSHYKERFHFSRLLP